MEDILHGSSILRASPMIDATLSLLLPAKDEASNLPSVLDEAAHVLPRFFRDYEIIVVDDGSIDETAGVVRAAAARDARIRLVQHTVNRGHGDAVRSGLNAATGAYVLLLDADYQLRTADIAAFLPHVAPDTAVLGYRPSRADPRHRTIYAFLFRLLVRTLFGISARDVDLSYKLFPRHAVQATLLSGRFAAVNTELLVHLRAHGVRFIEVPVQHFPRMHGRQTGGSWRVIVRTVPEIARLWWRTYVRRVPIPTPSR